MDDTGGAESTTTLQAVPTAHHEMVSRRLGQTGYGKLVFGFQVGFFMQDMSNLFLNPQLN